MSVAFFRFNITDFVFLHLRKLINWLLNPDTLSTFKFHGIVYTFLWYKQLTDQLVCLENTQYSKENLIRNTDFVNTIRFWIQRGCQRLITSTVSRKKKLYEHVKSNTFSVLLLVQAILFTLYCS